MEAENIIVLLIDYDHKNPLRTYLFENRMRKILRLMKLILCIQPKFVSRFETKHGYHYYISIHSYRKLDDKDLNYLQTLLGDDIKRTMFNQNRLIMKWKWSHSNLLFKDNQLGNYKVIKI